MVERPADTASVGAIEEQTRFDLPVSGSLPLQLSGTYLRTGTARCGAGDPCERHAARGTSMIHSVRLHDGLAECYKSRLVTLPEAVGARGEAPVRDLYANGTGNCSLLCFGNRIIAFEDFTRPIELSAALEPVGCPIGFDILPGGVSPHPKYEAAAGCLHTLSCQIEAPYLFYHVLGEDGALLHSTAIPDAGPSLYHDFCITRTRLIVFDLPVTLSMEAAMSGSGLPFAWNERYRGRIGVLPLGGEGRDMQWLPLEPCYVLHTVNARDDGDAILIDLVRHEALFNGDWQAAARHPPSLERWTLDLEHDRVFSETLNGEPIELPTFDARFLGTSHSVIFGVGPAAERPSGSALWRIDVDSGEAESYETEAGETLGECVFVPQHARAPEGQGWLVGFRHRAGATTELVVLDANALSSGPRACVDLGVAIPEGKHGCWIPGTLRSATGGSA